MNVTATYTHESVTLTATDLAWSTYGGSVEFVLTCPTAFNWKQTHTERVSQKQQPETLAWTFTELDPNTQYQWKVTQTTGTINHPSVESGTITTSDIPGSFSCTKRTASTLKFAYTSYTASSFARVARFYYARYDQGRYDECGVVEIPANTTGIDVSVLIKDLRNDTMYNAKMELYKKDRYGREVLLKSYVAAARTGIPSAEQPSVTLESITTRYDTHTMWVKLDTDYEGDHRFVIYLKEYVPDNYWHHLVLPLNEDTFYCEDLVTALEEETPTLEHIARYDFIIGLLVESDTVDIESKGFTYPIGNALDIPEPHTSMPQGLTVYGDLEVRYAGVQFDTTYIPSYEEGAPFSVEAIHVRHWARVLINKFDTLYKDWTYAQWRDFALAHNTTYAYSVVPKVPYFPSPVGEEPGQVKEFKAYIQEMHTRCESIKSLLGEAKTGCAVFASTGRLVKEMEEFAHKMSTNPDWSSEDAIDADPTEAVDNEYFTTLAEIIRDIL